MDNKKNVIHKKVVSSKPAKYPYPYYAIVLGTFIAFIMGLMNVIYLKKIATTLSLATKLPFSSVNIWILVTGILGMLISAIIFMIAYKTKNKPTKKDYFTMIIMSIIGFFTTMGFGAVIIILSSIYGLIVLKKK